MYNTTVGNYIAIDHTLIYFFLLFSQVHDPDEPTIMDDIAIPSFPEKNADPCTSRGCMWPKYSDGKIYVPYVIANHYCM